MPLLESSIQRRGSGICDHQRPGRLLPRLPTGARGDHGRKEVWLLASMQGPEAKRAKAVCTIHSMEESWRAHRGAEHGAGGEAVWEDVAGIVPARVQP